MAQLKLKPTLLNPPTLVSGSGIQLSASEILTGTLVIQSLATNVGNVYVGDTQASGIALTGIKVAPDDTLTIQVDGDVKGNQDRCVMDLRDIWVGTDTTGNGVRVMYIEEKSRDYNA